MQYILTEAEYAELKAKADACERYVRYYSSECDRNQTLCVTIEELREQKKELEASVELLRAALTTIAEENQTYCNIIAEMKRDMEGTQKALAEALSHEDSLRKAWHEALEGKNRLFAELQRLK